MSGATKQRARRRGKPHYRPMTHHTCDGAGCEGCGDSGFIRGPHSTPVPLQDLSAPQHNWRSIQRRDA